MHQYLLCVDFLDYISITAPESKENRKREWFIKEGDISRLNLCTKQTEEQKQANTFEKKNISNKNKLLVEIFRRQIPKYCSRSMRSLKQP